MKSIPILLQECVNDKTLKWVANVEFINSTVSTDEFIEIYYPEDYSYYLEKACINYKVEYDQSKVLEKIFIYIEKNGKIDNEIKNNIAFILTKFKDLFDAYTTLQGKLLYIRNHNGPPNYQLKDKLFCEEIDTKVQIPDPERYNTKMNSSQIQDVQKQFETYNKIIELPNYKYIFPFGHNTEEGNY